MKNSNAPKRHLLTDKVNVKLDVLLAPMMYRVGGEVDSGDVVAVDDRGLRYVAKELLE